MQSVHEGRKCCKVLGRMIWVCGQPGPHPMISVMGLIYTHIGSDGCICLAPVEVLLVLSLSDKLIKDYILSLAINIIWSSCEYCFPLK